jgi:hypothetical protein
MNSIPIVDNIPNVDKIVSEENIEEIKKSTSKAENILKNRLQDSRERLKKTQKNFKDKAGKIFNKGSSKVKDMKLLNKLIAKSNILTKKIKKLSKKLGERSSIIVTESYKVPANIISSYRTTITESKSKLKRLL